MSFMTRRLANIRSAKSKNFVWRIPTDRSICLAPAYWCKIFSMCANVRWRISGPVKAWNGANITRACSTEPSGFSVPAIMRIFFHRGFPRSTGWKPSLGMAQKPLTSVAVTAQALFCSPRHSPSLNSSDTTITVHQSRLRRNARKMPALSMLDSRLRTPPAIGTKGFDLVAFFDCLHDMADPAGAARHARGALKSDGTLYAR